MDYIRYKYRPASIGLQFAMGFSHRLSLMKWIHNNFEAASGNAVPCRFVYEQFTKRLAEENETKVTDSRAGALFHDIFRPTGMKRKLLRFGYVLRKTLLNHYCGLRYKGNDDVANDPLVNVTLQPKRWHALKDAQKIPALPTPPGTLLSANDKLAHAVKTFDGLLSDYLVSISGKRGVVSLKCADNVFDIDFAVDKNREGMISVGLDKLSKYLSRGKPHPTAYNGLLLDSWDNGLYGKERELCFVTPICPSKRPTINDRVTSYGLHRLLNFCDSTSWNAYSGAARARLVELGLFNPFVRIPVSIKVEVHCSAFLISRINERFPAFPLKPRVHVVIPPGGYKETRTMDLWCEPLKINVECNERGHRRSLLYTPIYEAERQSDIKRARGDDTVFSSFNPHEKGFSISDTAVELCDLYAHRISHFNLQFQATPLSESALPQTASSTLVLNVTTKVMDIDFSALSENERLRILANYRSEVEAQLLVCIEERRKYLLSLTEGQAWTLNVPVKDKCYPVYLMTDKTVPGLLTIHRSSYCRALVYGSKCYKTAFSNWRKGLSDKERERFLVFPTEGGRRKSSDTLVLPGALSLLDYYETTLLDGPSAIGRALIDSGLCCPTEGC